MGQQWDCSEPRGAAINTAVLVPQTNSLDGDVVALGRDVASADLHLLEQHLQRPPPNHSHSHAQAQTSKAKAAG